MTQTETSVAALMPQLRDLHVATEDRDGALTSALRRVFAQDADGNLLPEPIRFTAGLETRGIMLVEPSGGGKTTAVRRLLNRTAALNDLETGACRYVHVQVPSPATLKSLGTEILKATGFDEVGKTATAWQIFQVVRTRFVRHGIVALWLDEAQDLFLARSAQEIEETLKMLKSLMLGPAGVVLILSGTERLGLSTSFDPQVMRRFSKIVPRDLAQGADNGRIDSILGRYAEKAGLAVSLPGDISGRLIHASRQRFGRMIETILNAIECALLAKDKTLSIEHFAEAWGLQEGCPWDKNVFVTPNWASLVLDEKAAEFDEMRSVRLKKRLGRA